MDCACRSVSPSRCKSLILTVLGLNGKLSTRFGAAAATIASAVAECGALRRTVTLRLELEEGLTGAELELPEEDRPESSGVSSVVEYLAVVPSEMSRSARDSSMTKTVSGTSRWLTRRATAALRMNSAD